MRTVVGRDREFDAIRAFLDAGREDARILLIEGEAGIGKTTLWRGAIEEAREHGYEVLACAGVKSEMHLSFSALRDLLADAFPAIAEELPTPQRRAIATVLGLEDPPPHPTDPGAIAFAFLSTLRVLAMRAPTLLAVDDVQWLEPASAAPIGYALRRLDTGRLPVILCRRTEEPGTGGAALEQLDRERLHVLRPEALTVGALGRILHDRLGYAYPRPALARLHEASAGNPLYALELARALGRPAGPAAGAALPVPKTLRELVDTHLAALPAETIAVLELASALPRPSLAVVRAAFGHDPLPFLEPAVAGQIVDIDDDGVRFVHPLFKAAVYGRGTAARRRDLHRRLAEVVSDPEEGARHLALATDAADHDVAAALEDAASRTRVHGARAVAAELFEASVRLTPAGDAAGRTRRTLAAAAAGFEAGETDRALALLEPLVENLPDGRERVEARWRLGMVLADTSRYDQAMRLWWEALETSDDAASADIRRVMAVMTVYSGNTDQALEHADHAVVAAEASGDPECLAYALSTRALVGLLAGEASYRSFLDRALAIEPSLDAAPSLWSPTTAMAECARFAFEIDEAHVLWQRVLEQAVEAGDAELEWWATFGLARAELLRGDLARAKELSDVTFELSDAIGRWRLPAETLRAEIDALEGRSPEAQAALRAVIAEADRLGEKRWAWQARAAFGRVALADGDASSAADELRAARRLGAEAGFRHPGVLRAVTDEVEAAAAAGRLDQAEEALVALDGLGKPPPWAEPFLLRARGAVLASRGELAEAETLLQRALALHPPSFLPVHQGRTLLALGSVLRRMRRRTAARETLHRALALFEEVGATPWAGQARAEIGRIGGRPSASGELTPSERRIAELVAEGRTNKEVAAILVVADRTIESALTQIYRKLGVRSRTELARKLGSAG